MKKTYLKPDVVVVNFVSANMVATSGDVIGDGDSRPGRGANEQEGNWDNIWK